MELTRVERKEYTFPVAAPGDAPITGVGVALLIPRTGPTASTTWTTVTYADGEATVLLAGPDASTDGALVVPSGGADLWTRVTDGTEVETDKVTRVTVTGGGLPPTPVPPTLDALAASLVNDEDSALYAALVDRFGFGGQSA